MEGLEAADEQDALDVALADVLGDGLELSVGQSPLGSEQSAAHRGPAVDRLPRHGLDVAVDEAFDAVVDAEWVVACLRIVEVELNVSFDDLRYRQYDGRPISRDLETAIGR